MEPAIVCAAHGGPDSAASVPHFCCDAAGFTLGLDPFQEGMMSARTLARRVGVMARSAVTRAWSGCCSSPENENAGTDTGSEFREAPSRPDEGDSLGGGKLAGFQTVYFDYDSA